MNVVYTVFTHKSHPFLALSPSSLINMKLSYAACEEGPGICSYLMTLCSVMMILATLPLSLIFTVKVVQEYERAVIFRLGRLLTGGARGPGVFFIIPCVDIYEKIDMRTATYEIPPQEVVITKLSSSWVQLALFSINPAGPQV